MYDTLEDELSSGSKVSFYSIANFLFQGYCGNNCLVIDCLVQGYVE